jgi:Polypeptide deformylase
MVRGRRRRIIGLGDPDAAVPRRRAQPVRQVDSSVRRLIADMLLTMRRARGVGLACSLVESSRIEPVHPYGRYRTLPTLPARIRKGRSRRCGPV